MSTAMVKVRRAKAATPDSVLSAVATICRSMRSPALGGRKSRVPESTPVAGLKEAPRGHAPLNVSTGGTPSVSEAASVVGVSVAPSP